VPLRLLINTSIHVCDIKSTAAHINVTPPTQQTLIYNTCLLLADTNRGLQGFAETNKPRRWRKPATLLQAAVHMYTSVQEKVCTCMTKV